MSREAMQLALEALELYQSRMCVQMFDEAITALRQALVNADDTSQERVDEMAKREHEPWPSVQCTCGGTIYFKHTKREWVGLPESAFAAMTLAQASAMKYAELLLKEKNT